MPAGHSAVGSDWTSDTASRHPDLCVTFQYPRGPVPIPAPKLDQLDSKRQILRHHRYLSVWLEDEAEHQTVRIGERRQKRDGSGPSAGAVFAVPAAAAGSALKVVLVVVVADADGVLPGIAIAVAAAVVIGAGSAAVAAVALVADPEIG